MNTDNQAGVTIGTLIRKRMAERLVKEVPGIRKDVFDKFLDNAFWPNSIPILLFRNMLCLLAIPFETAAASIYNTLPILPKSSTEHYRIPELWECKEAVDKYVARLKELMLYESPHPSAEAVSEGEFVNKHLGNIKAKMASLKDDSRKEFHALCLSVLGYLQHKPFRSSVEYFIQTGSINGSFFEALQLLRENLLSDKFIEAVKDATAEHHSPDAGQDLEEKAKEYLIPKYFIDIPTIEEELKSWIEMMDCFLAGANYILKQQKGE